jgi:sulfate adenylyltransferase (ADP) / ATP adenylyltransferase
MTLDLKSGTLWQNIVNHTELAIADGSLHTIDTQAHHMSQNGYDFIVRVAKNIKRKKNQKKAQPDFNPFLPPEKSLTISDISPTHLSVLNKFNVVNHHLLIITRHFESQERLLTLDDFEALCYCLSEYPALGFYNGGEAAGASQKHKHMQLVPLPLYGASNPYPFSPHLSSNSQSGVIDQLITLPFQHASCRLPKELFNIPMVAANQCFQLYQEMLRYVNIHSLPDAEGEIQSAPYNLLVTTEWMLLVPRSRECWQGISVNAMGYVGSLFVLDQKDLNKLRTIGPLNLLQAVSEEKT